MPSAITPLVSRLPLLVDASEFWGGRCNSCAGHLHLHTIQPRRLECPTEQLLVQTKKCCSQQYSLPSSPRPLVAAANPIEPVEGAAFSQVTRCESSYESLMQVVCQHCSTAFPCEDYDSISAHASTCHATPTAESCIASDDNRKKPVHTRSLSNRIFAAQSQLINAPGSFNIFSPRTSASAQASKSTDNARVTQAPPAHCACRLFCWKK